MVWTQTAGKPAGNEPLGASRNDRQEPGKAMAWQFWQRQGDPRQLRREPMQRDSRRPAGRESQRHTERGCTHRESGRGETPERMTARHQRGTRPPASWTPSTTRQRLTTPSAGLAPILPTRPRPPLCSASLPDPAPLRPRPAAPRHQRRRPAAPPRHAHRWEARGWGAARSLRDYAQSDKTDFRVFDVGRILVLSFILYFDIFELRDLRKWSMWV